MVLIEPENTPKTIIVSLNDHVLFCQNSPSIKSPLIDNFQIYGNKYFLREITYGGPYRQGKHAVIFDPADGEYKYHRIRIWFTKKIINLPIGTEIRNIGEWTLVYDFTHKFDICENVDMKNIDKNLSISTKRLHLFNNEVELTSVLISDIIW